jgi:hypothetical protein
MPIITTLTSGGAFGRRGGGGSLLYDFSTFTFTRCDQTGRFGPTLSTCRSWYTSNYGATASWVNDFINMNVQGLQEWTVPKTGTYRILAAAACGSAYSSQTLSGTGARLRAEFSLTQGDVITIAVGQNGVGNGGGGGGTFVVKKNTPSSYTPLIIAGGGGARDGRYSAEGSQFHDANPSSTSGKPGGRGGSVIYNGGTNGNGGQDNGGNGGAGGGYFTDGGSAPGTFGGYGFLRGGSAPTTNSLVGGAPDADVGGFGGGGGTSDDQSAAGGGYSGGGGTNEDQHGGAGGSYVDSGASNRTNLSNNTSHGFVEITLI